MKKTKSIINVSPKAFFEKHGFFVHSEEDSNYDKYSLTRDAGKVRTFINHNLSPSNPGGRYFAVRIYKRMTYKQRLKESTSAIYFASYKNNERLIDILKETEKAEKKLNKSKL